jgi:hypothetical protein
MVFVFDEDGFLEVIDSKGLAQQYEPIDVESRVFVFYDEDGTWLEPNFTRPNRSFLWGWILSQGTFELVRNAVPDATVDPFEVAIKEAVALKANKYFKTLDEIASHVASTRRVTEEGVDGH